jgi:hypothetical protein
MEFYDGVKKKSMIWYQQYYPKTELQEGTALEEILNTIQGSKKNMIAKPDIGLRGSGVKKTCSGFKRICWKANFNYVVLIPFWSWDFYVRYPLMKK